MVWLEFNCGEFELKKWSYHLDISHVSPMDGIVSYSYARNE